MTMVVGIGWDICWTSHCPANQAFVTLANSRTAAAVAWARKYLVAASTARGWCCRAMSGRMARVLISMPIQASSQCELAKVIVVPRPTAINKIERMIGAISKRRILTNMFGVWARKLN